MTKCALTPNYAAITRPNPLAAPVTMAAWSAKLVEIRALVWSVMNRPYFAKARPPVAAFHVARPLTTDH